MRNLLGRAGDFGLVDPGVELIGGMRAQHIALASPAQLHLDSSHTIDRVSSDPSERNARGQSPRDHLRGDLGFGDEAKAVGNMSGLRRSGLLVQSLGRYS